jgi:phosphoheptose isomerase
MRDNRSIFLIGNGGSAAIVEHAQCDLSKGLLAYSSTNLGSQKRIPSVNSLTSPTPLISAIANDFGHEKVFSWQIQQRMIEGDILIAVSSSGNSKNILNGAIAARELGAKVISFTGFSNPALNSLSDLVVHVPVENYGVVEDIHAIILHAISQQIKSRLSK